jgi:hypothetical protein
VRKQPLALAGCIDQAIIGLPRKSRLFLRGIRLLPPRVGVTQMFM